MFFTGTVCSQSWYDLATHRVEHRKKDVVKVRHHSSTCSKDPLLKSTSPEGAVHQWMFVPFKRKVNPLFSRGLVVRDFSDWCSGKVVGHLPHHANCCMRTSMLHGDQRFSDQSVATRSPRFPSKLAQKSWRARLCVCIVDIILLEP